MYIIGYLDLEGFGPDPCVEFLPELLTSSPDSEDFGLEIPPGASFHRPLTYSPISYTPLSYASGEERATDVSTYKRKIVHVLSCSSNLYGDHLKNSDEKVYPIRHNSPKAHVLILNSPKGFKGGSQYHRYGAERDVELMKQLWEGFQCEVEVEENQTAKKMLESLVKFSKSDIHESCDFCVVIIMSHRGLVNVQDVVLGIDDKYFLETEDVLKLFHNSTDRPHLIGKPKLIFFQSCRGDSASPEATVSLTDTDEPTLQEEQAVYTKKETVPEESDILVAYPIVKDMKAFRNEAAGSWFINAITKVFSKKAKTEHVADMLTEVKNLMSQQIANAPGTKNHRCQVSAVTEDSLRKKLYVFPGFPKTNN
ncbi:caspase-2-like [Ciona intestinalis]